MNYRRFGRTGWHVSEIGYGMWGLAGWTGSDDAETLASLHRAIELGCNFFDTAWAYGAGKSEQILAKAIAHYKIIPALAGRTSISMWPRRFRQKPEMAQPPRIHPGRLLPAGLRRRVHREKPEESWRRDDRPHAVPHLEDRWLNDERLPRSIENMKKRGKVRACGISVNRWEPCNGIRAVLEGHADAMQSIYNIFDQNPEDALFLFAG